MAEQRRAGQLVVGRLQVMTSQNLATHGNGEIGSEQRYRAPYKSMRGEKSLTGRSSLFLRGEVGTGVF